MVRAVEGEAGHVLKTHFPDLFHPFRGSPVDGPGKGPDSAGFSKTVVLPQQGNMLVQLGAVSLKIDQVVPSVLLDPCGGLRLVMGLIPQLTDVPQHGPCFHGGQLILVTQQDQSGLFRQGV